MLSKPPVPSVPWHWKQLDASRRPSVLAGWAIAAAALGRLAWMVFVSLLVAAASALAVVSTLAVLSPPQASQAQRRGDGEACQRLPTAEFGDGGLLGCTHGFSCSRADVRIAQILMFAPLEAPWCVNGMGYL
jgi:hypothetical protein